MIACSSATLALLSRLEQERQTTNTPNVSRETGEYLFDFIRARGYQHILELGTANGYSSIYLLEAIAHNPGGYLLTIEKARPEYERACQNLSSYRDNCTIVCADATEFIHSLSSERFDLIFIDALKSATLEQFRHASTMVKPGGTIIIDDVVKWRAKMENFYQYLESESIAYEIVMTDPDDGVMVIRF